MFLYKLEYLNRGKISNEASIASRIGALKPVASIALSDVPKQKVMIMSIVMQRNAKNRSALLEEEHWREKAAQRALTYTALCISSVIDSKIMDG
jgi:hypothetical protein